MALFTCEPMPSAPAAGTCSTGKELLTTEDTENTEKDGSTTFRVLAVDEFWRPRGMLVVGQFGVAALYERRNLLN